METRDQAGAVREHRGERQVRRASVVLLAIVSVLGQQPDDLGRALAGAGIATSNGESIVVHALSRERVALQNAIGGALAETCRNGGCEPNWNYYGSGKTWLSFRPASGNDVFVLELSGQIRWRNRVPFFPVSARSVSPDGKTIAMVGQERGSSFVWFVDQGGARKMWPVEGDAAVFSRVQVAWLPGGRVMLSDRRGVIVCRPEEMAGCRAAFSGAMPTVSTDGRYVATRLSNTVIATFELESGREVARAETKGAWGYSSVLWVPGKAVFVAVEETANGGRLLALRPDGRRLGTMRRDFRWNTLLYGMVRLPGDGARPAGGR